MRRGERMSSHILNDIDYQKLLVDIKEGKVKYQDVVNNTSYGYSLFRKNIKIFNELREKEKKYYSMEQFQKYKARKKT
jgi:hypothetical protein